MWQLRSSCRPESSGSGQKKTSPSVGLSDPQDYNLYQLHNCDDYFFKQLFNLSKHWAYNRCIHHVKKWSLERETKAVCGGKVESQSRVQKELSRGDYMNRRHKNQSQNITSDKLY